MTSPPPPSRTPTAWYADTIQLLSRARAHWRSFALLTLISGIAGGASALLRRSVYRSGAVLRAQSLRDTRGGNAPAGPGAQANAQFVADLLTSDTVLRQVARAALPTEAHVSVEQLRRAIKVSVNYRTAVVSFTVDARTPQLARALAETTLAVLTAVNAAERQTRTDQVRASIGERTAHARDELQAAERALQAAGRRTEGEQARLRQAADLARQVYVQLRVAEELAVAQEAREAPTIGVIDPPHLPAQPDRPRPRSGVLVGLVIGAAVALIRLALAG